MYVADVRIGCVNHVKHVRFLQVVVYVIHVQNDVYPYLPTRSSFFSREQLIMFMGVSEQ